MDSLALFLARTCSGRALRHGWDTPFVDAVLLYTAFTNCFPILALCPFPAVYYAATSDRTKFLKTIRTIAGNIKDLLEAVTACFSADAKYLESKLPVSGSDTHCIRTHTILFFSCTGRGWMCICTLLLLHSADTCLPATPRRHSNLNNTKRCSCVSRRASAKR